MKNLLIATTALVATAGMASAEITFSGKGEAGMYRTAKTKAVAQKLGLKAGTSAANGTTAKIEWDATTNALKTTVATGTDATDDVATAADAVVAARAVANAKQAITAANVLVANASTRALADTAADALALANKNLAVANAVLASVQPTAAAAAVKSSDMVAYSGYDMNVAMSAETDSGIVFGMGFDMGAGFIADQDDDRAMDAQDATIATSALTATMNGYTLSIGSDKLDDTYDDTQNGDIGLSGNIGGVAFNLVHDLTDEVVKAGASYVAGSQTDRAAADVTITMADGTAYAHGTDSATPAVGDSDYVNNVWKDAVAATVETTSLSLGGAVGDIAWSLAATTGDDRGDSAAKGSVTYSGVENLSLTLAHDNVGKLEGITKVTAAYTMGSLTATLSMADDKNKNSNSNVGGKASTNLSLAYAANGLAATFATDESSQWWVNTQYDLGGGAQAFATVDHTEFAVVGLNFNF